ncbi:hypothetical protein M8818_006713 [Zalaria obscura]|uniref:Uncharacterized protein n=1 Tax=Zalaria obscura TaxID=2024903 RepID=A0ACC3S5S1_9PEZI
MPNAVPDPEKTSKVDESAVKSVKRNEFAGRPLVPEPLSVRSSKSIEIPRQEEHEHEPKESPTFVYKENGQRWMEQQEAKSLRMALEDMDLADEQRIHAAAQDEAAELVYKHQNPDSSLNNPVVPYKNPDLPRKDYHAHLRKGSYSRSHEPEPKSEPLSRSSSQTRKSTSSSRISGAPTLAERKSQLFPTSKRSSMEVNKSEETVNLSTKPQTAAPRGKKSYDGLANNVAKDVAASRRRSSGGSKRKPSGGATPFVDPNDKIYEEPEEVAVQKVVEEPAVKEETKPAEVPRHVRRNPFARVRLAQEKFERANTAPELTTTKKIDPVEIQKNPPTQSRKAWYLSNEPSPPTPPKLKAEEKAASEIDGSLLVKDGKEIRGEDIRAATSPRRKDRSPNLPQPTAVSDSAGRPIVSFAEGWGATKEIELKEEQSSIPTQAAAFDAIPERTPSRSSRPLSRQGTSSGSPRARPTTPSAAPPPPIPIINLPDEEPRSTRALPEEPDIPSINIQSGPALPGIPTINIPSISVDPTPATPNSIPSVSANLPSSAPTRAPSRPLPTPKPASRPQPSRPHPTHASTSPLPATKRPHVTPSIRRTTALCEACALPISGRILSAAGSRFHPQCFTCHACATNLECVAFYPEPERQRSERLARIEARMDGLDIAVPEHLSGTDAVAWAQKKEDEDGDPSPRFFCHLDFHELFSPRCKSCKTPIEGEVVVACGAEWHVGHFFCAQCGDPFDSTTPFVEREGYAWCLGCHTNRYSAKCKGCRKPVTELVVKALGAEWHQECFCCVECGGQFDDGRYFLRGDSEDPVCVRCEDRRLKA